MFITIYLFKKTSLLNKLISFFLLTIDSVGILISPYYNRFLDSFSVSNSDYGAGTLVRIVGRKYYHEMWTQKMYLGFGQTTDGNIFNGWKYYISDLGIIRMLYQFGIIGFIVCLLPILYGCLVDLSVEYIFMGCYYFLCRFSY